MLWKKLEDWCLHSPIWTTGQCALWKQEEYWSDSRIEYNPWWCSCQWVCINATTIHNVPKRARRLFASWCLFVNNLLPWSSLRFESCKKGNMCVQVHCIKLNCVSARLCTTQLAHGLCTAAQRYRYLPNEAAAVFEKINLIWVATATTGRSSVVYYYKPSHKIIRPPINITRQYQPWPPSLFHLLGGGGGGKSQSNLDLTPLPTMAYWLPVECWSTLRMLNPTRLLTHLQTVVPPTVDPPPPRWTDKHD